MSRLLASLLVLASLGIPSCFHGDPVSDAETAGKTNVRYLGVGGFYIERKGVAVMTAPYISDHDPATVNFGHFDPSAAALDKYLKAFGVYDRMPGVRAVFVGHAHYDHLEDVRPLLDVATNAPAVGNLTMKRILAGYGPAVAARAVALNDPDPARNYVDFSVLYDNGSIPTVPPGCAEPNSQGKWWPLVDAATGTTVMRVRAIYNEHPGQLIGGKIHLWPGCAACDRVAPPRRGPDYQEGEVLAYLFDFVEGGATTFRIYYEDAPMPKKLRPALYRALQDGIAVDAALLCTGNWREADKDPDDMKDFIRKMKPKEVVLHHWESFFDPALDRPRIWGPAPTVGYKELRSLVEGEMTEAKRVHMPAPGVLRSFPRP
jgi:L-ascorbate metabolism protein UlaG (beta-lactamase superfamily)